MCWPPISSRGSNCRSTNRSRSNAAAPTSASTVEAFPVPGKVALYLEDANAGPGFGTQAGDTLALKVSATRHR